MDSTGIVSPIAYRRLAIVRDSDKPAGHLSIWLDAVRGIAALAVVFGHAYALMFADRPLPSGLWLHRAARVIEWASSWSHHAVIIFFVMSGYLVGGPFLIRVVRGTANVTDYAAARLSRMYTVLIPALLLTLALDYVMLHYLGGQRFIDARPIFFPLRSDLGAQLSPATFACNAAFLQTLWCRQYGSNLSLWSLSNEAIYYAAWLGLLMCAKRPAYVLIPLILFGIVTSSMLVWGSPDRAITFGVYFGIWIAGGICSSLQPIGKWASLLALIAIFFAFRYAHPNGLVSDAMLSGACISMIALIEAWRPYFPVHSGFVRGLAHISFSLYAIHLPVLVFGLVAIGFSDPQVANWSTLFIFASIIAFCAIVAAVFWRLFESNTRYVKASIKSLVSNH